MGKTKVVVFTANNARTFVNPDNIDQFIGRDDVLINPMIPEGVAPHYWKKVGHEIQVMNAEERMIRDMHLETFGALNDINPKVLAEPGTNEHAIVPQVKGWSMIVPMAAGIALAAIALVLFYFLYRG